MTDTDCIVPALLPALLADGYEEAIIGVVREVSGQERVVYSVEKCLEILQKEMSPEEAVEYFYFNTACAYVGCGTPLYMYPYDEESINEEFRDETWDNNG